MCVKVILRRSKDLSLRTVVQYSSGWTYTCLGARPGGLHNTGDHLVHDANPIGDGYHLVSVIVICKLQDLAGIELGQLQPRRWIVIEHVASLADGHVVTNCQGEQVCL